MSVNGIEALSKISGLPQSEVKSLWAQVQENHRKLDMCGGPHHFEDITPGVKMNKKYRCTKCDGVIDGMSKAWYDKGFSHAIKAAQST